MKVIDPAVLAEAIRLIALALKPEAIYLYGSHAYGQPHQDSDIDLLVVVAESSLPPHKRALAAYRALRGLCLPIEIKVVTQAEFEKRASWVSSVEGAVRKKGKRLYERQPG